MIGRLSYNICFSWMLRNIPDITWQQKSLFGHFLTRKKHAAGQDTGSSIKVSSPHYHRLNGCQSSTGELGWSICGDGRSQTPVGTLANNSHMGPFLPSQLLLGSSVWKHESGSKLGIPKIGRLRLKALLAALMFDQPFAGKSTLIFFKANSTSLCLTSAWCHQSQRQTCEHRNMSAGVPGWPQYQQLGSLEPSLIAQRSLLLASQLANSPHSDKILKSYEVAPLKSIDTNEATCNPWMHDASSQRWGWICLQGVH